MSYLLNKVLITISAAFLCCASFSAAATLQVFACEPEWASLASEIAGDKVKTFSATHARQDPHYIKARPSLMSKVRRADIIICSGADLEVGWLPLLLERASVGVQPGSPGNLMAYQYVPLIEIPTVIDRSMGDVHPDGNPHVHLDPQNLLLVGKELSNRLTLIDPGNAQFYQKRYDAFESRLSQAIIRWREEGKDLRGMQIITNHKSLSYLIKFFGLEEVASLEPRPGLPPTASHLKKVLNQVESQNVRAILRAPYESDKGAKWISAKRGIPDLVVPYTVGGDSESGDIFALFDRSLELLNSVR